MKSFQTCLALVALLVLIGLTIHFDAAQAPAWPNTIRVVLDEQVYEPPVISLGSLGTNAAVTGIETHPDRRAALDGADYAISMFQIGGYKLGFWFAQQGSIYTFVVLIFFYAWRMGQLDRKFNVHED